MRFCAIAVVGSRWLGLLAVLYLSLFHWMREGYWEFSGVWQYGLPLLDPRVPAALLWWAITSAFWILLLLPLGLFLADRMPTGGRWQQMALGGLALGLGTRGIVGPLVVRAAVGSPQELLPGGGEQLRSWLMEPYAARWLVALTQAWWILPLLIVGLWLLGPEVVARPRTRWAIRGVLAAFALLQPIDAPYLLTAGGPHGATQSLLLLAFREGFGREEFGYACVLTVVLCLVSVPLGFLVKSLIHSVHPQPVLCPRTTRGPWLALVLLMLLPLGVAVQRNAGIPTFSGSVGSAAAVSLGLACMGGIWTGGLGAALSGIRKGRTAGLLYGTLMFPLLVIVLPMIRVWGYRSGLPEILAMLLGLLVLAPHLSFSLLSAALLRQRGAAMREIVPVVTLLAAWSTWTELGLDVMLSQHNHAWLPLQSRIAWELATVLRPSPLTTPGWPLVWAGGTILAWTTLSRLFHSVSVSSLAHGDPSPVSDGAI